MFGVVVEPLTLSQVVMGKEALHLACAPLLLEDVQQSVAVAVGMKWVLVASVRMGKTPVAGQCDQEVVALWVAG